MEQHQINRLFQGFKGVPCLVIGDVMIDAYYTGNTERISPEAPVPIVSVTETDNRMGGAANVALNLQALGAKPYLCGVVGADAKGRLLQELMEEAGLTSTGILPLENRPTTTKTRIISQQQHLLRVDEEITAMLDEPETDELFGLIEQIINEEKIKVIIFEDYDKGAITPALIQRVVALAKEKNIPTTVDPKKRQFLDYNGVTLFKPNLKELKEGLKIDLPKVSTHELDNACAALEKKMPLQMALITLSQHGVYIHDGEKGEIIPAHIRNISDVSGAGDTVIAVASLCLALDAEPAIMARLANLAGGLVCEKVGVVPIDAELLKAEALRLSK